MVAGGAQSLAAVERPVRPGRPGPALDHARPERVAAAGVTADGSALLRRTRARDDRAGRSRRSSPGPPTCWSRPGTSATGSGWSTAGRTGAVVSYLRDGVTEEIDIGGVTGEDVKSFLVSRDGSRFVAVLRERRRGPDRGQPAAAGRRGPGGRRPWTPGRWTSRTAAGCRSATSPGVIADRHRGPPPDRRPRAVPGADRVRRRRPGGADDLSLTIDERVTGLVGTPDPGQNTYAVRDVARPAHRPHRSLGRRPGHPRGRHKPRVRRLVHSRAGPTRPPSGRSGPHRSRELAPDGCHRPAPGRPVRRLRRARASALPGVRRRPAGRRVGRPGRTRCRTAWSTRGPARRTTACRATLVLGLKERQLLGLVRPLAAMLAASAAAARPGRSGRARAGAVAPGHRPGPRARPHLRRHVAGVPAAGRGRARRDRPAAAPPATGCRGPGRARRGRPGRQPGRLDDLPRRGPAPARRPPRPGPGRGVRRRADHRLDRPGGAARPRGGRPGGRRGGRGRRHRRRRRPGPWLGRPRGPWEPPEDLGTPFHGRGMASTVEEPPTPTVGRSRGPVPASRPALEVPTRRFTWKLWSPDGTSSSASGIGLMWRRSWVGSRSTTTGSSGYRSRWSTNGIRGSTTAPYASS